MMDPIELKSGDYDGTYKLVSGGEISLDFVNTVSWPDTAKEHDWLDCPENVSAWAVAAGIIDEKTEKNLNKRPQADFKKELSRVHDIRRAVTNALKPLAHGKEPTYSALEILNGFIRETSQYRYLTDDYQWMWDKPEKLFEVLNPVIWNAASVLIDLDHNRLGHCPSCDWIFYDTTRNRSRKWCDMEDCGSRDKALRYYHRSKSANDAI